MRKETDRAHHDRGPAPRRDKAEYDVFLAQCPSRKLLDRLSDKWVTLVLCALEGGPRRYSQLARTIAGEGATTQTDKTAKRGLFARR